MKSGVEIRLNLLRKINLLNSQRKLIYLSFILLFLTDISYYLSIKNFLNINNATYYIAFFHYLNIFILVSLAKKQRLFSDVPKSIKFLFISWLIWCLISFIRGIFHANDYWDWKSLFLNSVPFSMIPFAFFMGKNLEHFKVIVRITLKYLFPLGFLLIPLTLTTNEEIYSRIMIPVTFLIVFIPNLKLKWKIVIVLVSITSVFMYLGFRTNVIKMALSYLLLLIYFYRNIFTDTILKFSQKVIFVTPLIIFAIGVFGGYTIFNDLYKLGNLETINQSGKVENLMDDTRTFIYSEVLLHLKQTGNWLVGESSSGSYQSYFFFNIGGAINGKRFGSEVGILNILLWHGIIGVIIYLVLIYKVSFLAIAKSNNSLAKILGIFIAFRWLLMFIEEFSQFDLNFYFFWIIMGLISSEKFRSFSDKEIKDFLKT